MLSRPWAEVDYKRADLTLRYSEKCGDCGVPAASVRSSPSRTVRYVPLSPPPPPIRAPRLEFLCVGGNLLTLTQLFCALNPLALQSGSGHTMRDDPPRMMEDGHIDFASCIEAFTVVSSTL